MAEAASSRSQTPQTRHSHHSSSDVLQRPAASSIPISSEHPAPNTHTAGEQTSPRRCPHRGGCAVSQRPAAGTKSRSRRGATQLKERGLGKNASQTFDSRVCEPGTAPAHGSGDRRTREVLSSTENSAYGRIQPLLLTSTAESRGGAAGGKQT